MQISDSHPNRAWRGEVGLSFSTTHSLNNTLTPESLVLWYPGLKDLLLRINTKLPNVAGASHELRALRTLLSKQLSEAKVLRSQFPVTYLFGQLPLR
jgi:hypothetical protein